MGGCVLSMRPCAPRAMRLESVGSRSRHRSNTSAGVAESRPTMSSLENAMPGKREGLYRTRLGAANRAGRRGPAALLSRARHETASPAHVAADLLTSDQHGLGDRVPR